MRQYLINLRKERKMTQTDVAEQLKMSQQMYAFIEKGKRPKNISLTLLNHLAEIFSVSSEFLIEEENKLLQSEEENVFQKT